MLERKVSGGEVVNEGDVARRTSLLFESMNRLVQGAMEIVRRTFFEFVLRWYLSEYVPDADEATGKVRDSVLQCCRVALRLTYLLQDLYSFIVTERDKKEVAGLLKAELELLASEVDEVFIVAASRINEFERLFEEVKILDVSKRLLADAVREWKKIKEENLPTLYSALAEQEYEGAISSLDACRRFVSKFVSLFDPLRITHGNEESIKFLRRIDEVGEFIFDAFWMATIAGYHVARGIKVLISDFQGEKEASEVMKRILEGREAKWRLSDVDVERVAFSLIRVRHEIEDALSAAEKAIEMAERAESSISSSDVEVKLKVREARSKLEKWRSEIISALEGILELQRFIEKKVLPR